MNKRTFFEVKAASPKARIGYYAFGMEMPGRSVGSDYKYGMNGQLKENAVFNGFMSADFWGYDARLGRRWEVDPLVYSWQSPYATFNNSPIFFADPFGLEGGPAKPKFNFDLDEDGASGGNGDSQSRVDKLHTMRSTNKEGDGWGKYTSAEFLKQSQNYKNKISSLLNQQRGNINWTYQTIIDEDGVTYVKEYQNGTQIVNYYWLRTFDEKMAEDWVYMAHIPVGLDEPEVDLDIGLNITTIVNRRNLNNMPPVTFNTQSWVPSNMANFTGAVNQLSNMLDNNPNASLTITGTANMQPGETNSTIAFGTTTYAVLKQSRANQIRNALIAINASYAGRISTAITAAGSNQLQASFTLSTRTRTNRIRIWQRIRNSNRESKYKI